MTSLVKYKNHTEFSFYLWINWMKEFPTDSPQWAKRERFLKFAKTVCVFHAKKWDVDYLEKRMLKEMPDISKEELQKILDIFSHLVEFHKTLPITKKLKVNDAFEDIPETFIELGCKNGEFSQKRLPMKE